MVSVPDRAAWWADHYYDDECDVPCGLCELASSCWFCRVDTCYNGWMCGDCTLYHNCEDPHRHREDPD